MIEQNISTAKKILTKLSQANSRQEAKEEWTERLYKDTLLLALCGIPGPDIEKLYDRMETPRKEILQTLLTENPRLAEHTIGTL